MPEAAVHQNHGLPTGQNDVGTAGEILRVKPEANPTPVEKGTDKTLRGCISTLYARHHPTARGAIDDVSQRSRGPGGSFPSGWVGLSDDRSEHLRDCANDWYSNRVPELPVGLCVRNDDRELRLTGAIETHQP